MIALGSELLGRLGSAAVLLYALSSAASSPTTSSQDSRFSDAGFAWTTSNSANSSGDVAARGDARRYAQAALVEVKISKSILGQVADLAGDPAFATYLAAIDEAVTDFEREAALSSLVGQLQAARSDLQNRLTTVPGWLAVMRSVDPTSTRYIEVPARLRSVTPATITYDEPPSHADVEMLFEFDDILSA